jgi:allophanate hydrolase subunit 2
LKPLNQTDLALPPSGISLDLPGFRLPAEGMIHLRALPSTEHDSFGATSQQAFWSEPFHVTRQNDRQGHRLDGTLLTRTNMGELRSHGIVPGIVQVPSGGQPIIQLADSATMGGYPKIAAIIEPDLWRMGQARPGDRVCFHRIGLTEAARASDDHVTAIANAEEALANAFEHPTSWA